jgi:hypothetical protein
MEAAAPTWLSGREVIPPLAREEPMMPTRVLLVVAVILLAGCSSTIKMRHPDAGVVVEEGASEIDPLWDPARADRVLRRR